MANLEIGKGHKGKFLYLWAVFVTSYFLLSLFCTTANISQWFGEFVTAYFSTVPLSILLNWLAWIFNVGHLEIGERHESKVVISLSGLCDWLFFSHLCFSKCVFDFITNFQLILYTILIIAYFCAIFISYFNNYLSLTLMVFN